MKDIAHTFCYPYPRPSVTVDILVFRWWRGELSLLVIKRANEPFQNQWAFPGGFVDPDESLDAAAKREMQEETNVNIEDIHQLGAYGKPGRDPRGHTVTVAYFTIINNDHLQPIAASDAIQLSWKNIGECAPLAFDHEEILEEALKTIFDDVSICLIRNVNYFSLDEKNQKSLFLTLKELLKK